MPDLTGPNQADTKFKPGVSGNPAGRPKGARSKLGEDFLKALVADFNGETEGKAHGVEAIKAMRADSPEQYVKVIASLLPKEITGEDGAAIVHRIELVAVAPDDNGAG